MSLSKAIQRCLLASILLFTLQIEAQSSAPLYTIPVVFHILHQGGSENISDAQVVDAINILNRDFNKQNADTINVVPSFSNNIANVQFHFQLAGIDPNGNCTNGIIRHYTSKTNWLIGDFSYFSYTWPSNKYLNFYIVKNMNITSGAYTYLPGSVPAVADVIVAINNYCGSIGTGNVNSSRWLTQKVGHWFNLLNTWGLSASLPTICGDDGVMDTPPTKGFLTCNLQNASICNSAIVENMQNFMDGTPCRCMFTNGQKTRMHACITSTLNGRNNLSSSSNLMATGITTSTSNCIPLLEISALPSTTICLGSSITIHSYTSNASPTSYSWSADNGTPISNSTLSSVVITPINLGVTKVICVVANTNGFAADTVRVFVENNVPNLIAPNQESFENSSSFLPPNWTIVSPNSTTTYMGISSAAGSQGSQCVMMKGENTPPGIVQILRTPSYNFAANQGITFSFKYAYARQSPTHQDVFKVQASKDCGGTWKDIYTPSVNSMANGSGEITGEVYIPTPTFWKSFMLSNHPNFATFLNENHVLIRFYFKEDSIVGFGNRLYLDEINFGANTTGINKFTEDIYLNLYPNPTKSQAQLSFVLSDTRKFAYSITNINGTLISRQPEKQMMPGEYSLLINENDELVPGIYFVNMSLNGVKFVRKLIIH